MKNKNSGYFIYSCGKVILGVFFYVLTRDFFYNVLNGSIHKIFFLLCEIIKNVNTKMCKIGKISTSCLSQNLDVLT